MRASTSPLTRSPTDAHLRTDCVARRHGPAHGPADWYRTGALAARRRTTLCRRPHLPHHCTERVSLRPADPGGIHVGAAGGAGGNVRHRGHRLCGKVRGAAQRRHDGVCCGSGFHFRRAHGAGFPDSRRDLRGGHDAAALLQSALASSRGENPAKRSSTPSSSLGLSASSCCRCFPTVLTGRSRF